MNRLDRTTQIAHRGERSSPSVSRAPRHDRGRPHGLVTDPAWSAGGPDVASAPSPRGASGMADAWSAWDRNAGRSSPAGAVASEGAVAANAAVAAAWARLGVSFAVAPAPQSPDLEQLIIDTVRIGRDNARLLIMAAAWLRRHGACVARHRLAQMAQRDLGETEKAVLGWLLDESSRPAEGGRIGEEHGVGTGVVVSTGQERPKASASPRRFREVQAVCRPALRLQPVFRVHERHPAILERLEANATATARRWNLLAEPIEAKPDALRSREWIWANNGGLTLRALLGGDLRTSILAVLTHDEAAGASELELARRCCASRAAVRDALDRLEEAGLVRRVHVGRRREIRLAGAG